MQAQERVLSRVPKKEIRSGARGELAMPHSKIGNCSLISDPFGVVLSGTDCDFFRLSGGVFFRFLFVFFWAFVLLPCPKLCIFTGYLYTSIMGISGEKPGGGRGPEAGASRKRKRTPEPREGFPTGAPPPRTILMVESARGGEGGRVTAGISLSRVV